MDDYIKVIIGGIGFPAIKMLVSKMILRCTAYDLTWDDFSNEELLTELKKSILEEGKLNTIVELKKAIEIKDNRNLFIPKESSNNESIK